MKDEQLTWQDSVIRDGLTQVAYVAEEVGLHPEFRFSYRPMLAEEAEALEAMRDRIMASREPDAAAKIRGKFGIEIAKRLSAWSARKGDDPIAINENNVRRLRPSLQTKIYNIIAGFRATDMDPDWSDDDLSDVAPIESLQERLGN